MESTTETTTTNETQTGMPWADVAKASEEAQAPVPANSRRITDVLRIPVNEHILARIAVDNADDDEAMADLQTELDELKEKVKGKKNAIDTIAARMSERHEAVRNGVQEIKGEWILTDIFETNTVRYTDPETGRVMLERPMSAGERQQELPLGEANSSSDDDGADDDEASDEAPATDDSGDVEEVEGTSITDPEALLDQATSDGDSE